MSRREELFSPGSLLRVVRAVEWEPELELYRDGSSNQERYMEALSTLYGRWIRDESLQDLVDFAGPLARKEWFDALKELVSELPQKARQIVGFWRGMGGSLAAPKLASRGQSLFAATPAPVSLERQVYYLAEWLAVQLASIVDEAREV